MFFTCDDCAIEVVPDRELDAYAESVIFRDVDDGFTDGRFVVMSMSDDFLEAVDEILSVSRVEAKPCNKRSSSCFFCLHKMLDK